jgi:hypothetical protein
MNTLAPITPRLAKLLPLLASDKPGEVIATAHAINRTLQSNGCDWHDLVDVIERFVEPDEMPESIRDVAAWCLRRGADRLSDKERAFVQNMRTWRQPSSGQRKWLCDIFARLRDDAL